MGGRGASLLESVGYRNAVKSSENKIRGNKIENAILLDSSGHIIFTTSSGEPGVVYFTDEQCDKMRNGTLTHNHPSSSTFSSEDVNVLVRNELKAIRAVGDRVTYQLKKINNGKTGESFYSDYKAAMTKNKAETDKLYDKYHEQMKKGTMSIEKFNQSMIKLNQMLDKKNSDWLKANAKNYGYSYGISRRK